MSIYLTSGIYKNWFKLMCLSTFRGAGHCWPHRMTKYIEKPLAYKTQVISNCPMWPVKLSTEFCMFRLCHLTCLPRIALYQVMSKYISSPCHIVTCLFVSPHITLKHGTLCHVTSRHVTTCHFVSSRVTSRQLLSEYGI